MFDSVVSNLRKTYPKDKMQDTSTSFCFIRLLHPTNEHGLKIEVGESLGVEDEGQLEEGDHKVENVGGLRVFYFISSSWSSYHSGADCNSSLRPSEMQTSSPQREGGTDGRRQINALGLYTRTHLRVFYRFIRFSFYFPLVFRYLRLCTVL